MRIEIKITPASTGNEIVEIFDDADEAAQWIRSIEYADSASLDALGKHYE